MSYRSFRYCPFCGEHIPQQNMVKFCPFCGEKFLLSDNNIPRSQYDKKIDYQDNLTLAQVAAVYNEHPEINIDEYNRINLGNFVQSECYSIIIKDAPNKQGLVTKLEKVLLRGSFAIQLAIDNIPSIISYKTRSDDIMALQEILIEEKVSTSVIAGDFNIKPTFKELFNMFDKLTTQTQQIIKQLPINLWMGDIICAVFPNSYRENSEGIVVITDKNIYFISNDIYITTYRWFVRSYNLLSKVVMQDNCLLLTDKGMKVTSICFSDKQQLSDAYRCIHHTIQRCKS